MNYKSLIHNKFFAWFSSRMPVADSILLNQRSTYILPTRSGVLLFVMVLLMLIGATNYQNNLAFLLTFLLVGIGLVCIVFTFKNLQGLEFSLLPPIEIFAEEKVSTNVIIKSQFGKAHFSIGIGYFPLKITNKDYEATSYYCDVPENNEVKIDLNIEAGQRGYWQLPRVKVHTQYPFGWLNTWSYFQFKQQLVVYPKVVEPPEIYQQQAQGDESDQGNKFTGNEDLYGLKPYQQGESLAHVDWKAYARERGLYIREFAAYQNQQLSFNWQDYPDCHKELRLSYLAYMVVNAASQGLSYSMVLPDIVIASDDGEKHRQTCLKALALFGLKEH